MPMASKPQSPMNASLLFGAQSAQAVFDASSGTANIPKLTLKDVDRVEWFTNRPYRETGSWKPQRLVRQWNTLFGGGEPNAIAGFSFGELRSMVAFEMFKPRWNNKSKALSFRLQPLDARQKDAITGLDQIQLSDISLFIDDTASNNQPPWYPNGQNMNFTGVDFSGMDLSSASMENSVLTNASLQNTNLSNANLFGVYGTGISGANANFEDAVIWIANLSNGDFSGANFTNVNGQGVGFQGSNLTSANFQDADLQQGNFINTNLTGANFTGAYIPGAQFYGATWGNTTCTDGSLNSGTNPCPGATPYG